MSMNQTVPGVRHEVLFQGRVVRCFEQRPGSLWAMFEASVDQAPASDAIRWEPDGQISYQGLRDQAVALSNGLRALGLQAGDRVATLVSNRPEYVVTALALWRLGAILVPLDTRLQTAEIEHIVNHSGARMLLCEAALLAAAPAPSYLPAVEQVIVLDQEPADGQRAFVDLLQDTSKTAAELLDEEATAAILYTSGTTGVPKGVVIAHVNMVHSTMHFERVWRLPRGSRSLLAIPGANVTGLVTIILTMLRIGGCIVMTPPFRAADFLRIAAKQKINHTFMVPAQYKLCLMAPDFDTHDLSSWVLGSTGGAPMPLAFTQELRRKIPSLRLSDGYGATELASPAIIRAPEFTDDHPDSIGQPVACAQVVVMTEAGTEAPVGEPGELWIKGPMVCREYWKNPEATAENFVDGFWKSGDIGSIDAQGFIRLHDRKKDVVNRGGYKIYSAEVENVLSHHPDVSEVAVVPKPDNVLGERVHAVVSLRGGAEVTEEALRAFCAERLADYKVPESFTLQFAPLPRNSNGKITKRQLRDALFPPPVAA